MTEAVLNSFPINAQPSLEAPFTTAGADAPAIPAAEIAPGTAASRLQEYIRAGKFSPAVAAQLNSVLSADSPQPTGLSPLAPQSEMFVLDMVGNSATGCVLAILALGAIALSISFAGFTDNYLLVVAGLIFAFVMLAVVAVGSINQAPAKPRPPKPVKAAKPAKVKGAKAKPAKGSVPADSPTPATPAPTATP